MSNQTRIEHLYHRWMDKTASPAEQAELWELLANERPETIVGWMQLQWEREDGRFHYPEERRRRALKAILKRGRQQRQGTVARLKPIRRWAAAILLLLTGSYWIWKTGYRQPEAVPSPKALSVDSSGPTGVTLTLADGGKVSVDTLKNGVLTLRGGAAVRVVNGTLIYENTGNRQAFNTVSTPRGRQFRLLLSDGTKVWLNAGSSVRYPLLFTENNKEVTVKGEAYFEVAKNAGTPFRVNVNGRMQVEVLGTDFNIHAYEEEKRIRTTLVSGKVRLTTDNDSPVILKPGEQGVTDSNGRLYTAPADIQQAIAWKNGAFNFDGASFGEVMHEVERWYDITVVYEGPVPVIAFQGELSRDMKLSDLLATLEKFGVRYKTEGKQITILSTNRR